MKKTILALTLLLLLGSASPVYAHDLLPKQVVEYLKSHPQATPQEIQAYAQTLNPEIAAKFSNSTDIIRIVRNQQTSIWDNAFDFFKLGVGHILSGPDHILFVLSMLLVFVSVTELLQLTSTFTVAHSITLLLAGAGILTLSPKITEPLIALSIAAMALLTVFAKGSRIHVDGVRKLGIVFFFGLFHGLGFAGLLREIDIPANKFVSSLFAFNIGIEGGQLIIIACALPLVFLFRKALWYSRAIQIFAVCISLVSLFWVVQRVFGF